jgi:predicted ATPase
MGIMLTKIAAQNFKAFGDHPGLDLSLSPLTILLGENNSGKTSAMDAIAVLVQTARDFSGSPGLKWSGDLIDLGMTGENAIHNRIASRAVQLQIEITAPDNFLESIRHQVGPVAKGLLPAQTIGYKIVYESTTGRYQYEFLLDGRVLVRNMIEQLPTGGNYAALEIRDLQNFDTHLTPTVSGGPIFNPDLFTVSNLDRNNPAHNLAFERTLIARTAIPIIRAFLSGKVFFLGAYRGLQKGSLDASFNMPDVGRNGQHTLQVLSTVFAKAEYRRTAAKIREWSKVFGLLDVSSGWAGGAELHSGYADPLTSAPLPLRSAGFGSQQILPVIVQLFASPEDSLVVIEEPEISLHPAAQVELVKLFADAMSVGRQVAITTHSQYLVMALQEEVNKGIQPKDISVYHFSRVQNDSTAKPLLIGPDGVMRDWIPSFAKVERELLSSWMSRVHGKFRNE